MLTFHPCRPRPSDDVADDGPNVNLPGRDFAPDTTPVAEHDQHSQILIMITSMTKNQPVLADVIAVDGMVPALPHLPIRFRWWGGVGDAEERLDWLQELVVLQRQDESLQPAVARLHNPCAQPCILVQVVGGALDEGTGQPATTNGYEQRL